MNNDNYGSFLFAELKAHGKLTMTIWIVLPKETKPPANIHFIMAKLQQCGI